MKITGRNGEFVDSPSIDVVRLAVSAVIAVIGKFRTLDGQRDRPASGQNTVLVVEKPTVDNPQIAGLVLHPDACTVFVGHYSVMELNAVDGDV